MHRVAELFSFKRIASNYGMLLVLLLLCLLFSVLTISEQYPTGALAAESLLKQIKGESIVGNTFLIIVADNSADCEFDSVLQDNLAHQGATVLEPVFGSPPVIRDYLNKLSESRGVPDVFITTHALLPTL